MTLPNIYRAAKLGSASAQAEDPGAGGGGHYYRSPSGADMRLKSRFILIHICIT